MTMSTMNSKVQPLYNFIVEREKVRIAKEAGHPRPWTTNPILAEAKFCNMHREHDRVTKWIADSWRTPHQDDPYLFFAMVVARRCLNHIDTMAGFGYPVPWKPDDFLDYIDDRIRRGERIYGDAYKMVAGAGDIQDSWVKNVLDPIWQRREFYRPQPGDTLLQYHSRLIKADYLGHFGVAQIIADLKYTPQLANASDWWTYAAPGPGSIRGHNRVFGRFDSNGDPLEGKAPKDWLDHVNWIRSELCFDGDNVEGYNGPHSPLHAQDTQNALCEFDKYERIRGNEPLGAELTPTQRKRIPRKYKPTIEQAVTA
jgi:hypothetical protein